MSEKPVSSMAFEEAMAELEKVVGQLESGAAPLAQSLQLYEYGNALKAHCDGLLASAQARVDEIVQGPDGRATGTRPVTID
jgi:exodeoxyribonuclease VII small subunit